jgi:hypothetical protein
MNFSLVLLFLKPVALKPSARPSCHPMTPPVSSDLSGVDSKAIQCFLDTTIRSD